VTRRAWARVLSLFRKSDLDREFDAEAQSHLDLATDDYLQRGLSLPEARRLARLKFGSMAASKDAHRDSRGVAWLERCLFWWSGDFMRQALRLWIRQAARHTALTAFVIGSLAVSLAGGAFALSLNSAVLWRSLPFQNADDLVSVQALGTDGQPRWLSWRELESITESRIEPFDSVAGYTAADVNALSEPGLPPEPLSATVVSPGFFHTFGVRVAMGGLPQLDAYGASRDRVVLLTHQLWQRRYRGAGDIVGRTIRLSRPEYLGGGDEDYRVIGVLTSDTWLFWKDFDVVLPMQAELSRISNPSRGLFERTVARTTRGAPIASARSAAPMLLERMRLAGGARPPASLSVSMLQEAIFADLKPQLTVVLWLAIMVLSLAGINVVISTIAQAAEQRRGTAIRLAVGASYSRLFGDTLYQHGITLLVATAIGVVLAQWLVAGVGSQMPAGWLSRIPGQLSALRVDANVLQWLGAALVATILFSSGSVQAITRRFTPWSLLGSANAEDNQRSRSWRSMLVGVEIALCSAVVITSVTLVAQLTALRAVTFGVDDTRTSAVWVNLGSSTLSEPGARVTYYDRILREAGSLAGIEAVGGVSHPFNIGWGSVQVRDDSSTATPDITALTRTATPSYLLASGIRLVEGRWFGESDRANAPIVTVVSESLARARWPNRQAIGRQLTSVDPSGATSTASVIGVVADTRHAPHLPPDPIVYRAVAQDPPPWLYLIVRAHPGAQDVVRELNNAIWRVNPDQPIEGPWSVRESIDDRTVHLRFLTLISIVLGGVGLVLAASGLYALTSWSVSASKRSIAVRRAVGASDRQIVSWYVAQWARTVVPGLIGGWMLQSFWTSALIAAIQGLQAPTPLVVLSGTGLMAVAAAGAAMVPLRRALAADSVTLIR
jgi:putative ABC transport system permease protein